MAHVAQPSGALWSLTVQTNGNMESSLLCMMKKNNQNVVYGNVIYASVQ